MNYMFLLLLTFKIIKKKLNKIQEAMGFQASHTSKQKVQPFMKSKEEASDQDGVERSLFLRSRNSTDNISSTVHKANPSSYESWMVRHPSAVRYFDRLMKGAIGKRIMVFLDYDGTLSPIVNDPDRAFMSDEMRAAVCEVANCFPTAIISGRSREKVKAFVKLSNVYYAGSHGMDIMAPASGKPVRSSNDRHDNTAFDLEDGVPFQPAKKFLPATREILNILQSKTRDIPGSRVEDNGFSISVHFRQVQEENYGILEEMVKSVLENYPEFCLNEGKKVLEIRPSIKWNKGHALEYFLETLGLSSSNNILPVYIGDDRTDEDAFKVIHSRGEGYPIIVSSIPRDTRALYSLRDPSEVQIFLSRLAKWRKISCSSRSLNFG